MLSGPQNSEFLFSKVLEIGTQRSIKYSRLQINLILSINKNKEPHKIKLIRCLNSSGDIVADLQLIFMFVLCIFLKFVGFDVNTAVTSAMLMLMNLHWSLMYEQLQFVMMGLIALNVKFLKSRF